MLCCVVRQKLSVTTEKRGARTSFKLSKKLPFIKKVDKSATSDDDGKGGYIHVLYNEDCAGVFVFC